MSKLAQLNALLADVSQKENARTAFSYPEKRERMLARLFKAQQDLILDPKDRKACLCPRRAGKTTAMATYMALTCMDKDPARVIYIARTRTVAKRLIWSDLKRINDAFELGFRFNNVNLEVFCPNGSQIFLGGADSEGEIDKYRGGFFHLICLDEAKSFAPRVINMLVDEVLDPTLMDYGGTLVLGGTPGAVLAGKFYEVTRPDSAQGAVYGTEAVKDAYWSVHKWTTADNIAMPHIWEQALKRKKQNNLPDSDPRWRREWMGEWIRDDSAIAFRFDLEKDTWIPDKQSKANWGLPEEHEWKYVLAIDLGYDDDTAFVVLAYADTHPICYEVFTFSAPKLTVDAIEEKIVSLKSSFGFEAIIGDRGGLGKTVLATLAQRGHYIEPADKHEKRDYVELINSDFLSGRLKVRENSALAQNLQVVTWNERGNNFDKSSPDHDVDAFIYGWRYCYHHLWTEREQEIVRGSQEWMQAKLLEEEERFAEQCRRKHEEPTSWWEDGITIAEESPSWMN